MIAANAIQKKMQSYNAKKEAKMKELKDFVSRFSANASKGAFQCSDLSFDFQSSDISSFFSPHKARFFIKLF
jgi:ATPase subunit of ABC transporter with duplicated ATPase domains